MTNTAALAAKFFAARNALNSSDATDTDAEFQAMIEREIAFMKSPCVTVRDVMLKAFNLIEFFENEGVTPSLFAAEVRAFIEADAERDLIDPPAERARAEAAPVDREPATPDPNEPSFGEVKGAVILLEAPETAAALGQWVTLFREGETDKAETIAQSIRDTPPSKARGVALYLIRCAATVSEIGNDLDRILSEAGA